MLTANSAENHSFQLIPACPSVVPESVIEQGRAQQTVTHSQTYLNISEIPVKLGYFSYDLPAVMFVLSFLSVTVSSDLGTNSLI